MYRFLTLTTMPLLLLIALPHCSAAYYPIGTGTGTAPLPTGTGKTGPTGTGTVPLPTGTYGYAYAGLARDMRIVRVKRGDGLGWD